jgi:tight adherence protein B
MALVGELRAGSDPARALLVCGEQHAAAPHAARAARLGADVAAALRMDAAGPRSLLAVVAGVWELQSSSGAGLADVLEQMAESHRRSRDVRRTLEVELAGPRATARTMSLLPVFGIGLGILLGADPLTWLTTTPWGLAVLLCGVSANVAGFVWIRAIVASVESAL